MWAGCDTFVGRVEALSLVQAQAGRALANEPRLILVVGDPGVGKTALVERSVAQLDGFQVLRGSGDESETDVPYALAGQLFGDRAPVWAGMPGEPFAVGAGLLDVLGGLQDSGAVAVVVDDAHWADVSSLKALLFALRRLRADRVLGLLAVRTEQEHRLPAGIGRQLEIGGGARVRLPGLTEAEVDQLLSSWEVGLPRRAVRRLWEHTGGNPLWLRALVDELPVEQLRAADLPLPAPVAFGNGVQERLAGCSAGARDLVVAAAVAGGSSPLGELGSLAGLADPFAALDEAGRCGLLTSRGTPPAGSS